MQGQNGSNSPASLKSLLFGAIFFEAIYIALLFVGDWHLHIPIFLALYFCAFAVYLYFVIKIRGRASAPDHREATASSVATFIIAASFIFRLTIFWSTPSLSGDIYRYIWDGRVQNAGLNPYGYPPESPDLASLRNNQYEKINHKDFSTPYPPAAEMYFRILAKISTNLLAFKFGIAIFDFILVLVLYKLLQTEQRNTSLLLIYAWHPLPIIDFAGAGHLDVIAMCFLMFTIWLVQRGLPASAGGTLALGTLTKFLPAFSLPWLIRKGSWKMVLAGLVVTIALTLQYYTPDRRMVSGLFAFYSKWWFNDSIFRFLYSLAGAEIARYIGGAVTLLALAFCWFKKYSVYRSLLIIYGTILLFSPVVHPWYVCWVIPLLVFHQNAAWLFFSGWIAISYIVWFVYPVGEWKHDNWLMILVYTPLYAMLLINWIRSIFSRRS
jgi:alpha-1,6-mannosyltransferase